MVRQILKRNWLLVSIYFLLLFVNALRQPKLLPTLMIFALYLFTYLVICENEKLASLNKELVIVFK
ncbi:MAG: hypothetical protein D6715_14720, partial [Calditrichaeota bacterium]